MSDTLYGVCNWRGVPTFGRVAGIARFFAPHEMETSQKYFKYLVGVSRNYPSESFSQKKKNELLAVV
jgi:hypothetical protein